MDLSESMKSLMAKQQSSSSGSRPDAVPGVGYVTEKLYMLLQLYLQNKGWNPSSELLQCFAELKDSPLLPNAAYLQVLASRLALDGQGRLVLRENGKIVLPFEHFANAVMLKHMSGPHGLHLSLEATMRAVIDSYSIGRDNFGMEKEFILEVVNSCPNPACRYYKSHLNPFEGGTGTGVPPTGGTGSNPSSSGSPSVPPPSNLSLEMATDLAKNSQLMKQQQLKGQQQAHHLTMLQQNRALAAQQSLDNFNNLSAMDKQRMLAAMCPPNGNGGGAGGQGSNGNPLGTLLANPPTNNPLMPTNMIPVSPMANTNPPGPTPNASSQAAVAAAALNAMKHQLTAGQQQQLPVGTNNLPVNPNLNILGGSSAATNPIISKDLQKQMLMSLSTQAAQQQASLLNPLEAHSLKINEYMRNAAEVSSGSGSSTPNLLDAMTPNKDLLALHNGAWTNSSNNGNSNNTSMAEYRDGMFVGQDKIVRVFAELMRNMSKMKTFIRPAMCKPYGKQSESLQKSLMDTIQLVQSLRNCLPASHIPVNSWKSEDRQFRPEVAGNYDGC